jgi:hypothetical protein
MDDLVQNFRKSMSLMDFSEYQKHNRIIRNVNKMDNITKPVEMKKSIFFELIFH